MSAWPARSGAARPVSIMDRAEHTSRPALRASQPTVIHHPGGSAVEADLHGELAALRFPYVALGGGASDGAGPGDETAAGGGPSHLRASHADREQVIGTLKAAFVQGMLAKDELD